MESVNAFMYMYVYTCKYTFRSIAVGVYMLLLCKWPLILHREKGNPNHCSNYVRKVNSYIVTWRCVHIEQCAKMCSRCLSTTSTCLRSVYWAVYNPLFHPCTHTHTHTYTHIHAVLPLLSSMHMCPVSDQYPFSCSACLSFSVHNSTYSAASQECEQQGGRLVTLQDDTEWNMLLLYLGSLNLTNCGLWVGYRYNDNWEVAYSSYSPFLQ